MAFLPSLDTDLSNLSLGDLQALKGLLESELALSKARQSHIESLLTKVVVGIGAARRKRKKK